MTKIQAGAWIFLEIPIVAPRGNFRYNFPVAPIVQRFTREREAGAGTRSLVGDYMQAQNFIARGAYPVGLAEPLLRRYLYKTT